GRSSKTIRQSDAATVTRAKGCAFDACNPANCQCRLRVVCHEDRRSKRRCATVREMKVGPSRPAVRFWPQTAASCCRQKRWWCCVKKTRERHAVREMKEDPSEPSCRGRLQTAMSCFGQKPR